MAEPDRVVRLAGDESLLAWQSLVELDGAGLSPALTLVGGLMVYAHARAAGLASPRPTSDADVLVDVLASRPNLTEVAAGLASLNFELASEHKTAHRFQHPDGRVVDVMVADHLPSHVRTRLAGRPAFRAPAGQQAINRREFWRLEFADGMSCAINVPNVLGALVAKGAAWIADSRNPERHLQDAATLFAAVSDASALDYNLSTNDRKRLQALRKPLQDPRHPAWGLLDARERVLGQQNLELIARAAKLERQSGGR